MSITVKMQRNSDKIFKVSDETKKGLQDRWKNAEAHKSVKKELMQIVRKTPTATESMTVKKSDTSMPKDVDSNTQSVKDSDNVPVLKDAPSTSVCDKVESSKTTVSDVDRFSTFWTILWWVRRIKLVAAIVYSIYMITQNTSMEDISSSFVDFCTVARSASSETFSFFGKVGEELLIHFGFATRTLPVIEEKVEDDTNPVVNMVLLSCASFAVTLLSNMG